MTLKFSIFQKIFSKQWLFATILVLAATMVMVRLGIWQLDRLQARREFNARVLEQINLEPLQLTQIVDGDALFSMEYRRINVVGEYDHENEIALRNQVWHDQYGVHLLTPLKVDYSDFVILVDRGWIPGEEFTSGLQKGDWREFNETGRVTVSGVIRRPQESPDFGRINDPTPAPGDEKLRAWHLANIPQIQKQMPYLLLPVYIQQSPDENWAGMPYRSEPDLELTEGSHQGYAIQWFTFSMILFFGYPFFIVKNENEEL